MSTPSTTIVPFASLPSCAVNCGALYDANGACVPPVNTATDESSWDSCFCAYDTLQPLKSGANDVCNGACAADAQGLSSIQSWFTSLCNNQVATTGTTSATSSSTAGSGNSGKGSQGGGGNWASTHVNWIVFIVVVVVAIVGIWTGACIWRRKYLKKKDRLYELGKGLPSTVAVNTQGNLVGARESTISNGPGVFMSGSGGAGRRS
ncbi:hypothetical protein F5B22DRAFT_520643 [Xylaria bambusicola]|uniref:uncharacterized protein n=1 Tax=Xylaria bambusicola TaxID=326684 RepID=UPI00200723F9|nr:uncharacterized protein F5B22DRAFT_520643 [Xylaria bambusicola]KAI0505575.1 hypothetical protein F5B22DRAFT_520643 [Xylaria bambusicola]